MRIKKLTNKWYKIGNEDNYYYSIYPNVVYNANVVGDGTKEATPKEMQDALNNFFKKNPNNSTPEKFDSVLVERQLIENGLDLPPGTYKYLNDNFSGIEKLVPISFRDDHYVALTGVAEDFIKDFNEFISNEEVYRKLNVIYKEGFLAYGPPGNGKTSTVRNLVQKIMPKDSIVIVINKDIPENSFIETMKNTLGKRLKIFIFEEFTYFTNNPSELESILTFCDGENSLDKSLIIATTNYPELLPGNIVERPSRFDKFYEFDNPSVKERKLLLDHYLMKEATEQDVVNTKDMSIAAIKEACLLAHKRNISLKDSLQTIKKQLNLAKNHFKKTGKLGL